MGKWVEAKPGGDSRFFQGEDVDFSWKERVATSLRTQTPPQPEGFLTLANQLTILRMSLSPFLAVLLMYHHFRWALVLFLVAGLTDLLDGLIARLGRQKTTLGAMLDPMADKVLLASSFVVLTWGSGLHATIPAWLAVVTLSRDAIIFASVAIVNLAVGRRVFYPSLLGKFCTASQLVTAGFVILLNALGRPSDGLEPLFKGTLLFTVTSAVHYVYLASIRPSRRF
jgi:cardiolipin synthase